MSNLSTKPRLHLYTSSTPNGYKPPILLEELIAAYPANTSLTYDFTHLSFDDKDQKTPQFLEINPNGRIPALVDDNTVGKDGKSHKVFESANILLWLVGQYDPEYKFWFQDPVEQSVALSWIFFAYGGVGPMQGQANHFYRYAPEKIEYGIKRYQNETSRLYSVFEGQLEKNGDWLVGDKYSIVDINVFGWVRKHSWAGVDISPFPLLQSWLDRIHARPAAHAGLGVPTRAKVNMTPEEEVEEAKKSSAWVMEGNK